MKTTTMVFQGVRITGTGAQIGQQVARMVLATARVRAARADGPQAKATSPGSGLDQAIALLENAVNDTGLDDASRAKAKAALEALSVSAPAEQKVAASAALERVEQRRRVVARADADRFVRAAMHPPERQTGPVSTPHRLELHGTPADVRARLAAGGGR